MPGFSHAPLQRAVFQALDGDAELKEIIPYVYDRAPQNAEFPYIAMDESIASDWSTKTTTGVEHALTLHIWSREGGRMQTATAMEHIHRILHNGSLAVDGHSLVMSHFVSSSIRLESDGWTYHGVMRFRMLLEAD